MMWVMDIRHRLDEEGKPLQGGPIGSQALYFGRIAAAGSAHRMDAPFQSVIRCWRRPGRKPCSGRIHIARRKDNVIEYACPACADNGLVHGWQGTCWDLVGIEEFEAKDNLRCWITPDEYEAGRKALHLSCESEAIFHAAVFDQGRIVLAASPEDMEMLADEIAAEANQCGNRKAQRALSSLNGKLEEALA